MELREYPNTVLMLMQAIAIRKKDAISMPIYKTTIDGNNYSATKLETDTHSIPQDIFISAKGLCKSSTSAEWHLIGTIVEELYLNNCLWYCDPKLKNNGSIKKAIKGLIDKNILWKTDIVHFYFVNPTFIRRGRELEVLYTTGQAIFENNGIDQTLLRDRRPIRDFDLSTNTPQIGYGYTTDIQETN